MKKFAIVLAVIMLLTVLPMTAFAADSTYCVAGSDGLCGESWNPAGNPMTLNANGLYEKVFNNIPGGAYEFKITDGTWNNSWGKDGQNYPISLSKESHVTILFNADTKEISVEIEEVAGAAEVELSYTVAGAAGLCGVEWDPSQNPMTKNADGLHEITFTNVAAGNYGFKVTVGSWSASWGEGSENKYIDVTSQSDVKIVFNPETTEITVTITPVGGSEPDPEPTPDPEPVEPKYCVAGSAALCGADWDAAQNEMALNADGLYEIVFENVPGGNHAFKITDGTWYNSWGINGQDYKITLTKEGTVTILFHAETTAIEVKIVEKEGAEEVEFHYFVAGTESLCGVEWEANTPANQLTLNPDGLYEIILQDIEAGDHAFKITDGTWGGCWGGEGKDGNYEFHLNTKGAVKILFNAETKAITVEGDTAPTADNSFVYGFVVLMAVSAAAVVLLTKKKAI